MTEPSSQFQSEVKKVDELKEKYTETNPSGKDRGKLVEVSPTKQIFFSRSNGEAKKYISDIR